MRGPGSRETARGDVLLLAGCLTLALVALALPRNWALAISSTLRDTALRPLVSLEGRAREDRGSRGQLASAMHARDSLTLLVQQTIDIRRENENLRSLLGLKGRLTLPGVAAEVLHRPTVHESWTLLLDVGRANGVQVFDPVVTADGLVGYIVTVSSHASSALTWEHPSFAASAVTADGRVAGFIRPGPANGSASHILELQGVALRDSLPRGTVVLTAGKGESFREVFPSGRCSRSGSR